MIRDNAAEFGALIRLVAESDNLPLIFHCIGGKDRTGVAAALILTLVGVPWDAVREDYLRSNETLEGVLEEQISRLSGGKVPVGQSSDANVEALRRFFILDGANIDAARDEVLRLSGSFENYAVEKMGLSRSHLDSLRASLLTN
jgi:protein-tyrosine phosphatase